LGHCGLLWGNLLRLSALHGLEGEMEIRITGASDDLIEIEGDIREEFSGGDKDGDLLAFSDGTLLDVTYDNDGIWRIKRLVAGSCAFEHQAGDVQADTFDIATMRGDIAWVVKSERGQYSPLIVKKADRT
jgi:hypothetical protein